MINLLTFETLLKIFDLITLTRQNNTLHSHLANNARNRNLLISIQRTFLIRTSIWFPHLSNRMFLTYSILQFRPINHFTIHFSQLVKCCNLSYESHQNSMNQNQWIFIKCYRFDLFVTGLYMTFLTKLINCNFHSLCLLDWESENKFRFELTFF